MEWSFTKSIFRIHITVMFCNQFLHQLKMAFSTWGQDINNNQTVISPSVTHAARYASNTSMLLQYRSRNCSKKQLLHSLCNNLCFHSFFGLIKILNNWRLWVPHLICTWFQLWSLGNSSLLAIVYLWIPHAFKVIHSCFSIITVFHLDITECVFV